MTEDKFRAIFAVERDYSLPRPKSCPILFGMIIFEKYMPNETHTGGAEHDVILGPIIRDLLVAGITEQDASALYNRGWLIDSEGNEWLCCYV